VLNVGDKDAHLVFTLFFEDRPPMENIQVTVKARSDRHIGMHKPEQLGAKVPRDTCYGIAIDSDVPVIVQYSRLDVTQPNFTLMTTIPYGRG
jgi:hypothetical protein